MEKLKSFIRKYPGIDIGTALIIILIPIMLLKDNMISDAMIQSGWCAIGDSICLLKHYGYIIFAILLLCIFIQLFWSGIKKLIHIKNTFQKEIQGDFYPTISQENNIFYLKITCPKKILFCTTVTFSLEYLKPESSRIENTKIKTKNELYKNLIGNVLNPDTIKTSRWFDFPSAKARRNKISKIPIFEIDPKEEIFYLFRKSGKPKMFRNDEKFSQLDEVSFGHGEYDFKMIISARNSLGKKIIQPFSFPIKF